MKNLPPAARRLLHAGGLLLLSSFSVCSQAVITGTVKDAESGLSLSGASVFAQNTTRGTRSDSTGAFRLVLEPGGYDLIISFTGYTTQTVTVESGAGSGLEVALQKADNSMSEVVVRSSAEVADGWAQYGDFFVKHFIGATPNADSCTLLNPEALRFFYYKRNDRLKVIASAPLEIRNRALGYTQRYTLDSFVHYYGSGIESYRGQCLYIPMEGTEEEVRQWGGNRRQAYLGSRVHFLRAYFDSTLKEEGFTVSILAEQAPARFYLLASPYDSSYYYFEDSLQVAELWFPEKVSIAYSGGAPESRYLESAGLPGDVKRQVSYIQLAEPIRIRPNGFYSPQRAWLNQGYWSWKNVADQLPLDYEPD